ncbi:Glycoside Hydrolase Family 16 protein [Tuber magnatum]|uniref:Glycoside Hydrolase Family 16 protein n=1 Tax=Tuber magnatum TaxID=42249 RepID=A0A317SV72_9PEZI|nr:Glycoside Hydrolase Family 16 protein [Tuber magnatum]
MFVKSEITEGVFPSSFSTEFVLSWSTADFPLPEHDDVSCFWPGFWTMGNLGHQEYLATTEGCLRRRGYPSPGKSKSAPELDAIEASVRAIGKIIDSASVQVSPFYLCYQPDYDYVAVYYLEITAMNAYRGGFFKETISTISVVNSDWYNRKQYKTYGFEYEPGSEGMIEWNIGALEIWSLNATATGPNGNIGRQPNPNGPMDVVANVRMESSLVHIDFPEISVVLLKDKSGEARLLSATSAHACDRAEKERNERTISRKPRTETNREWTDRRANERTDERMNGRTVDMSTPSSIMVSYNAGRPDGEG